MTTLFITEARPGMSAVEADYRRELSILAQQAHAKAAHLSAAMRQVYQAQEAAARDAAWQAAFPAQYLAVYAAARLGAFQRVVGDLAAAAADAAGVPHEDRFGALRPTGEGLEDPAFAAYLVAGGLLCYPAWRRQAGDEAEQFSLMEVQL